MTTAIFDVAAYEALHGPIETWDYETYEKERLVKYYEHREAKSKLRKQKVLGFAVTALGTISSLMTSVIPEMQLIALGCFSIGVPLMITDKVVIY